MNTLNGIILALCIIAGALFAMCDDANAVPHVYWDPENITGVASDTSDDPYKKTSPVLTWERCLELGVMGDTIGLKQMSGDTPSIDVLRAINSRKADRMVTRNTREFIQGHGQLPYEEIDESTEGGYKIKTICVWTILKYSNGELGEDFIGYEYVVEVK